MQHIKPEDIKQRWGSGDYIYAAIGGSAAASAPSGIHHRSVNGREYPVARIGGFGDAPLVECWCKRSERFPEPIKGFNS